MSDVLFPGCRRRIPTGEGVLATWFVSDGDQVASEQLIAEVQVDKVSAEVVAPATGHIHLLVAEEQAARQGDVIANVD